jgi:hypothetical protein
MGAVSNSFNPGNDLFFRDLSVQVFSALECFTSEFGMESGSATPLQLPGINKEDKVYPSLMPDNFLSKAIRT